MKVLPFPSSLETSMRPPCASTIRRGARPAHVARKSFHHTVVWLDPTQARMLHLQPGTFTEADVPAPDVHAVSITGGYRRDVVPQRAGEHRRGAAGR